MNRLVSVGLMIAFSTATATAQPRAETEDKLPRDVQVRVLAQKALVHTGPSVGYRELDVVSRGDTFDVLERSPTGFWLRIMLPDGTSGWIQGDLVFPVEGQVDDGGGLLARMGRSLKRTFMSPPVVAHSSAEVSFSAGLLDGDGMFVLRPAIILAPHAAIEATIGLSPRAEKNLFVGGLGLTLRLIPDAVIGPFVHVGAGAALVRPKVDNFVDEQETLMTLSAGGGFELSFKKQITLRIDARRWVFFDPDKISGGLELSGGLAIFF